MASHADTITVDAELIGMQRQHLLAEHLRLLASFAFQPISLHSFNMSGPKEAS
jgi:hypothetical protein